MGVQPLSPLKGIGWIHSWVKNLTMIKSMDSKCAGNADNAGNINAGNAFIYC